MIVDLKGKLTAGLGDQILRESIDELLAEGKKKILLNLSEVSFMDSAGVGELVAGLRTAKRFGAALKLLNASERVQATLYMARLLPIFELYVDETEAVATFSAGCQPRSGLRHRPLRGRPPDGQTHSSSRTTLTAIGSALVTLSSTEHSGQLMVSPTSSS